MCFVNNVLKRSMQEACDVLVYMHATIDTDDKHFIKTNSWKSPKYVDFQWFTAIVCPLYRKFVTVAELKKGSRAAREVAHTAQRV